jgi:hypothetical protein
VKDVLEIQQQLAEVQSQLDSETTQRKILANETEKIAVELNFRAERIFADKAGFSQVWNALRQSTSVLSASIASLITVGVAILPWLVVILPAIWLLRKASRRWRRNRAISSPPTPATT